MLTTLLAGVLRFLLIGYFGDFGFLATAQNASISTKQVRKLRDILRVARKEENRMREW